MGMGRVVLVQIAEASGLLCRTEASFQKSLGTKSSEDLTTRNEEYGLTKNNSCRPGAIAAWPKSFFVFGNGQRRDWHEQPPSLPLPDRSRRSHMPNVMEYSPTPVFALEIDRDGHLSKKTMKLGREEQLANTLLQGLHPGIRVATVDVPTEPLDACEQAIVEQALTKVEFDGIRYSLVGASGSAKKGKFYAVETKYEKRLAERFRFSPQAAMTYFGILVSSSRVMIEVPDCRLLVVEDHQLGTNDCRGWISQSLFKRLQVKHRDDLLAHETQKLLMKWKQQRQNEHKDLPLAQEEEAALAEQAQSKIARKVLRGHRFYQFRLSFDKTQAKGSFKVMADELAEKLEADIILPKSSVKPKYQGGVVRTIRSMLGDRQAHSFRGHVLVGIRDVSRDLEFQSSYTLVEHAPDDSIELEIKPYALRQIEKLRKAWEENNFTDLFELLGTQKTQSVLEVGEELDPEYTSSEYTVADGALVADGTGYMLKHPFVNHHLQKVLARWAYRLCTSGGFRLPGFALADDGYLVLHDRQVFWGSDWIPKDRAIASVPSRHGLVVRYPIRMKEDLLPFENLSVDEIPGLLAGDLQKRGCHMSDEQVAAVMDEQLQLKGTLTLHSEAAARNGGDFDFDQVCVVEGDKFPRFVQDRFMYQEKHAAQKNKAPKPPSPWWNLPQVAMQARGNQIGSITDLKTSCLANGRDDLARQLVDQLQNALDQLKHGTQPDQEIIRNIRNEVGKAPWLKLKQKQQIADMNEHLLVTERDKIGKLYNFLRKELGRYFSDTAVAPLSDFRGLIGGANFTPEIFAECSVVNKYYANVVTQALSRRRELWEQLEKANAEVDAKKNDAEARKEVMFRRNQASAAFSVYEQRSREELRALIDQVRIWAQSKSGTRLAYLSALHAIVCRDRRPSQEYDFVPGTGSIVFYAFPQEVVDQIAERTGGRPVSVEIPSLCDGEVEIDREGRIFLVSHFTNGEGQVHERLIFLAQVTGKGEVFRERDAQGSPIVIERVRSFPIQPGRSEVQDGIVTFPGTQRRPEVPKGTVGLPGAPN
jgi:hypothetical protein